MTFVKGRSYVPVWDGYAMHQETLSTPVQMGANDPHLTFLALRDLGKLFGFEVVWEPKTRTAYINNPKLMGLIYENVFTLPQPFDDVLNILPNGFEMRIEGESLSAQVSAQILGESASAQGVNLALFFERWGNGNSGVDFLTYSPFIRTPPGNDYPTETNLCKVKNKVLSCTYYQPVTPGIRPVYFLAKPIRL